MGQFTDNINKRIRLKRYFDVPVEISLSGGSKSVTYIMVEAYIKWDAAKVAKKKVEDNLKISIAQIKTISRKDFQRMLQNKDIPQL